MAVRLATLLAAAAQEPHVPDPEVGRIVDAVAAQFVAAGGPGAPTARDRLALTRRRCDRPGLVFAASSGSHFLFARSTGL